MYQFPSRILWFYATYIHLSFFIRVLPATSRRIKTCVFTARTSVHCLSSSGSFRLHREEGFMSRPCLFLHQGPFDFIEKSKNPCFYSENKVRCVPYFFLAGFSKCGTSDLYARVIKHPQVTPTNKEMKWFSRRRFPEYYYAGTSRVDAFPLLSFFVSFFLLLSFFIYFLLFYFFIFYF